MPDTTFAVLPKGYSSIGCLSPVSRLIHRSSIAPVKTKSNSLSVYDIPLKFSLHSFKLGWEKGIILRLFLINIGCFFY